jgi:hypothetical protein
VDTVQELWGDICHLIEVFSVLNENMLKMYNAVVGSVYVDEFKRGYFPESCPPSSHVTLTFSKRMSNGDVSLHWMDGGIQPERPLELEPK